MASTSKRRKHPGVVLIKPDVVRRIGWRARYADPDSGRMVKVSLSAELTTDELRRLWAVTKSRELRKREDALRDGAVRATGTSIAAALEKFFTAHDAALRDSTVSMYRRVADKLIEWAADEGIKSADGLTRAKLADFRTVIVSETRRVHAAGTPRKQVKDTGDPRSGHTINSDLRKIGTVLKYVCDLDLLPKLTHDDLRRSLKKVTATVERSEFLKPAECKQLLEAALRHDAKLFDLTREEKAGIRPIGTTARYEPIAPFVAYVLLTGCRLGEALRLPWKQLDLSAIDHEGNEVGEIHLKGSSSKTHRARTIDLTVSPAIHDLLVAMKEASGERGFVFTMTKATADASAKRLRSEFGAPEEFTWQALRRTCGTFLTNAPGIFGAASAHRSARQLGHSVQVAERHYLGTFRGIPREARTLEQAMKIEDVMAKIAASAAPKLEELRTLVASSALSRAASWACDEAGGRLSARTESEGL